MNTTETRQALVLGAGLAGAACCATLARRGWSVQLMDAGSEAAQGASGLPVGMLSPHVTRSPTPLSRLCALGVADAHAQLERLVPEGAGWQPTEVDNLGHDPGRKPAALVRPAALVQAWLDEAQGLGRLQTRWSAQVQRLERRDAHWFALDAGGVVLGRAPVAVVACAFGAHALLQTLFSDDPAALPLRPVQGQLTLASLTGEPLAPRPMRNNGVFVPSYEDRELPPLWPRRVWAMGSTYARGSQDVTVRPEAHERNAASLEQLHPAAADHLRRCAERGELLGWAQVRCASLDRVPMVGAVPDQPALIEQMRAAGHRRGRIPLSDAPRLPGLYMMSAMGSRGLTLAHWCANWLAASMSGEASTLPDDDLDLERAFDPARFAWKSARRQDA
ncbi:FAD-dependent oxidoreductase [Hydrogenophaga sp. RWCD_12]|uniref:FAD-dependent oxidoreductase n=1 Tax=Hydrogenophaga sp. RWCD_12 TaxID=3391190 RepID=UPI003984D67C